MLRSWLNQGHYATLYATPVMARACFCIAFVICEPCYSKFVTPAPHANMTNDAQCLLQVPLVEHQSCTSKPYHTWRIPCTECSSTSTMSQKFHLYCVHCCTGLRASHDFVNATHNTARQQLSQKWDCHLWKTKHERKIRKSTAHSFQTVKPQLAWYGSAKLAWCAAEGWCNWNWTTTYRSIVFVDPDAP